MGEETVKLAELEKRIDKLEIDIKTNQKLANLSLVATLLVSVLIVVAIWTKIRTVETGYNADHPTEIHRSVK